MAASTEEASLLVSLRSLTDESRNTNGLLKTLLESGALRKVSAAPPKKSRADRNSVCLSTSDLRVTEDEPASRLSSQSNEVLVKFGFLEIYEINTKTQSFTAEILVQLKWFDETVEEMEDDELDLYLQDCWQPEVQIFNLIKQDVKRQQIFVSEEEAFNCQQMIVLRQKIKGTFQTKMLLHEFPFDYQELPITLCSRLPSDQVILKADPFEYSYINRDTIDNIQDWQVFSHVDIIQGNPNTIPPTKFVKKETKEKKPRIAVTQKLNKLKDIKAQLKSKDSKDELRALVSTVSSFLTARCRIRRRTKYYFFNILFSMMTLISLSFVPFAIDRDGVQFRIVTTMTLLMTTFTFRNMVSSLLPPIPYLTLLDMYMLGQTSYLSGMVLLYGTLIVVYRRLQEYSFPVEMTVLAILFCSQVALHVFLLRRHVNRNSMALKFIQDCDIQYENHVRSILQRGPRRRFSTFTEKANKKYSIAALNSAGFRPSISSNVSEDRFEENLEMKLKDTVLNVPAKSVRF